MPLPRAAALRAVTTLSVLSLLPAPALAASPVADAAPGTNLTTLTAPSDEHAPHDDHVRPDGPGDVFAEGLTRPEDPYIEDPHDQRVGPLRAPRTPHEWVGTAPDPGQVPEEWTRPLPVEQVEPSSVEELMSPDTGYFAALEAAGESSPAAADFQASTHEPGATPESSTDGAEEQPASPGDQASTTQARGDEAMVTKAPEDEVTASSDEVGSAGTMPVESSATVKAPPTPDRTLPNQLDASAGWQYSFSCDPNNKPGMIAFADLISQHYGYPKYYTSRTCLAGDNSQHYEGRAVDWPMNAYNTEQRKVGDSVAQWLTANNGEIARRFGIMSVIWNKRSWYVSAPGTWYTYTGPSPHTDHLHISFTWDGAMKRTSWWTGRAVSTVDHGTCRVYSGQYAPRYTGRNTSRCATSLPQPPESPYRVLLPWARTAEVKVAQQHLGFTGSGVDGVFGPMTVKALLQYQRAEDLYVTGVLDNQTWAHMVGAKAEGIDQVSRHNGTDRYEVAANLSSSTHSGGGTPLVYVASGQVFPAALSGGAAAGAAGAPMLLVKRDSIPSVIRQELERLAPERIVVLGGTKTINRGVARELRGIATSSGSDAVQRVSGGDRYEVAAELALRTYPRGAGTVYLANGQGFADALTGAALGGLTSSPLLLLRDTGVPGPTARLLQTLSPNRIVILGGSRTIPDAVVTELQQFAPTVTRIGGTNRYAVSVKATKQHYRSADTVYVVSGQHFPAALTGGAAGARSAAPVLPTKAGRLPDRTRQEIIRLAPSRVVILGGTSSVSRTVANQLRNLAW